MKKFFTFFTLIMFVLLLSSSNAQYAKKGVVELGGTASFSSTTSVYDGESADESTTTISFMPELGYFIIDNVELALRLMYSSSSFGDYSSSSFGAAFAPGYVFDLQSSVYPFVHAFVGYSSSTFDDGTNDETYSGLLFGGIAGVKVLLGKNALLNIGVNYMQVTSEPEDWDGDRIGFDQFGVEAGFSIFLP